MNIYKDWKAKLESADAFMLKYSKITVCLGSLLMKSSKSNFNLRSSCSYVRSYQITTVTTKEVVVVFLVFIIFKTSNLFKLS